MRRNAYTHPFPQFIKLKYRVVNSTLFKHLIIFKEKDLKKLIYTFIFLFVISGIAQSQPFVPSVGLVLRGGISLPLSGGTYTSKNTTPIYEGGQFKDYFRSIPGVQIEGNIDLSPSFGFFGTFGADFLTPKDARENLIGATYKQSNAVQLSGYIGPRLYINIPGNKLMKLYADAAFGFYSLKYGDEQITFATNPISQVNFSYSSASQIGFNAGIGLNLTTGPSNFVNLSVKYHNIIKKDDVNFVETYSFIQGSNTVNGTANDTYDIAERSYLQLSVGIGFSLKK